MDLAHYRSQFARFNSRAELARYRLRTKQLPAENFELLAEEFAHLFDPPTVAELIRLMNNTEGRSETEAAGNRLLAGAAVQHSIGWSTREYEGECRRRENASFISRRGLTVASTAAPKLIAEESNGAAREELAGQWIRALKECAPTRVEWYNARRAAVLALGFDSLGAFWSQTRAVDLDGVQSAAAGFLGRTEDVYFQALSRSRKRNAFGAEAGELRLADQLRWRRLSQFDRLFTAPTMERLLTMALEWMGLGRDGGRDLRLEFDVAEAPTARSEVYLIEPPHDVRAVITPGSGVPAYLAMFETLGRGFFSAGNSASYFSRQPEFIYSPDRGSAVAFAQLFANLHLDQKWVSELYAGGRERVAQEVVAELALLELHDVREDCARFAFWYQLDRLGVVPSDADEAEFAERLRAATGFTVDGATLYFAMNTGLGLADDLRGRMFEAVVTDHLLSAHGRRWWSARRAMDELRDIWNTASRYSVEDLAGLLGLGRLEPEPLADRLSRLVEQL